MAVTIALGLGPDDPLARAGIDFVVYEEAQAIADAKPADASMLERAAREMRVALPEQLGEVRYVCLYPFSAGPAHHLLITTPLGKATLLLIPGRPLAARAAASAKGLKAAVMPVPGGVPPRRSAGDLRREDPPMTMRTRTGGPSSESR